nr:Zinc finger RING type [Hymenolepis microstoma]
MARRRGVGRSSVTPRGGANISQDHALEQDERRFARPDKISPHLFCVICSEVFINPYRAPCGHSYCYTCITKWMETAKICPVDRKSISLKQLHHDFILESIIGDYTVACPWRSSGCSYVGPLCQLDSHKKICVMNPDLLPEVLRAREKENLKRNSGGSMPSTSSTLPPPVSTNSHNLSESVILDDTLNEDEEGHLPPAPPPSLVMRLFQSANESSRDLLCNFLGGNILQGKRPAAPTRGRGKRGRNV